MAGNRFCPESFKECFCFDESELNPTPRGVLRKALMVYLTPRYSMVTLMRLAQYFYNKSQARKGLKRSAYAVLASYLLTSKKVIAP